MIALIILIVAAGMGGLIYEVARRMERESDPLTRRELTQLAARPDLSLTTPQVDIPEQTHSEVQELKLSSTRTYWQGAVGTYCELCYWGMDLLGEAGVEAWIEHCSKAHRYVLVALGVEEDSELPRHVAPSEEFARTTEGTIHG